jgi:hypothetical protein
MKDIFVFVLIGLITVMTLPAAGQNDWVVGGGAAYHVPIGGLHDRFLPTIAGQYSAGRSVNENWYWEVRGEFIVYDRENVDRLSRDPDIIADSISMDLELYGLGFEGRYHFLGRHGRGIINPYLGLSAGMYRWFAERGAYDQEGISVPEFSQRDWSAGFGLGIGNEFIILPFVSLALDVRYHVVVGELWPTLSLGLENVGGFQTITASTRLRLYF